MGEARMSVVPRVMVVSACPSAGRSLLCNSWGSRSSRCGLEAWQALCRLELPLLSPRGLGTRTLGTAVTAPACPHP
jgi:hypothetical protein